jgi:hypothetical protein
MSLSSGALIISRKKLSSSAQATLLRASDLNTEFRFTEIVGQSFPNHHFTEFEELFIDR